MSFLMPIFLWLLIPFVIFFIKSTNSIVVKTHVLILILLIITLARPVQEEVVQKSDVDAKQIIIAIDISYSMHAKDISPTRYIFAKETIKHLLSHNITDNIMLIAFTSNPLLLSPFSTDHTLVSIALDTLNPEFILTKGTSLKKLFTKLTTLPQTPQTLILMTDGGEENNTELLTDILQKSNISLITLALGTTQGTTVSKKDGTLVKDKEGNLVVSRINPILATLTHKIGGKYLSVASTPKETASIIHSELKENKNTQQIQKDQHSYKEFYQFPLLLATLLFLFLHTRAVKYVILFFVFLGLPLQGSLLDNYYLYKSYQSYTHKNYKATHQTLRKLDRISLQSQFLLANSAYKMGKYKKAIELYTSLQSTSIPIKQQLYYNTANAYVQLHKYTKAKIYYIKALQLGFDKDALHNLKLCVSLKDKKSSALGIAHPKSQSPHSTKSESAHKKADEKREEDQPSSSSGMGEKERTKETEKQSKLISYEAPQKQPLSSKVYELINKGYIYETQPW
ncbi:MAG: VWA domain-containing protein [Sulfurovum sp.]|nr:VWA domain-containing protein [Sulfurovum sp.]